MRFLIHIVTLLQILNLCIYFVNGQRVPPGVSPQHYQQQQQYQQAQYQQQQPQYQQQHHQQVPVQHQQPPVQQHQVPVQQVPQHQVPQQQVPQQQMPHQQPHGQPQQPHGQAQQPHGQPHSHGHGHQQGKILDTQHIMQEKDHIAEHMDVPLDTSKMSEQELQFHYFKMHDADNNNKLDGCELIKSLIHWHGPKSERALILPDEDISKTVDDALGLADINKDGFIDYHEYKTANKLNK